jgi:hypothetical protein
MDDIMRLSEELEARDSERHWLGTVCTSPKAYLSLENDAQTPRIYSLTNKPYK